MRACSFAHPVRFAERPAPKHGALAEAARYDLLDLQQAEVRLRDLGDDHAAKGNYSEADRCYEKAHALIPQIQALQAPHPQMEGI